MSLTRKNILVIMTGSIACFKACSILSALRQKEYALKVVMSPSSLEFIGKATIEGLTGEAPITDMYAAGSVMDHIHLVRWADLILVAPATANYINKISTGLGDDLLTTLFLAHDFQKPFLVAPAMNTKMYLHPTVQNSLQKLKNYGVEILETASGVLACGEVGFGRLLDPQLIVAEVEARTTVEKSDVSTTIETAVKKIKILITSGGTAEPIDDVRVISNRSTGKTGAYLAEQLINSGFEVHYLHAKNSALPKVDCDSTEFVTFMDLESQLSTLLTGQHFDWVIHCAAVSDYSVAPLQGKISSDAEELNLLFRKNKKLLPEIKKLSATTKVIGFKLTSGIESTQILEKVQKLFLDSHCDYVIQNDWRERNRGFDSFNFFSPNLQFDKIETLNNLSFKLFTTLSQELT